MGGSGITQQGDSSGIRELVVDPSLDETPGAPTRGHREELCSEKKAQVANLTYRVTSALGRGYLQAESAPLGITRGSVVPLARVVGLV